jgi:CRP/FNR family transcriptional regulator, anaerobic regulatory protein
MPSTGLDVDDGNPERLPVTPTDIDDLPELRRLPLHTIADGQLLFDETRVCLGFPLVGKGSIKVFKTFPNGRELLLYHVTPGETCVVSAACLFSGLPYTACAATEGAVELRMIPPALFDELMGRSPFRRFVMGQFTQRLSDLMALVDAVFSHRLDQRLAARLLVHRAERGERFALTHQQLADELGSIREVISRLLRQFEDRGWIATERGAIRIVSPAGLQEFAAAPPG